MNSFFRLLAIAVIAIPVFSARSSANVVGYVNRPMLAGDNLFVNPLATGSNTLQNIFGTSAPVGTTVSLWNPAINLFDQVSVFQDNGLWSGNFTMLMGVGAKLTTPSSFTMTFVGEVRTRDGGPIPDSPPYPLPPLFTGPNGMYLRGDILPVPSSTGSDIFLNIFGRNPNVGEQMITLTSTHTYLGGGAWSGGVPSLAVTEAAFFNIGPVPEPSSAAMCLLGFALFAKALRRKK
jgi:hypothetical protein